ncbi:MAG: hypothetical protein WC382_00680 [Methanoregulaceae archaeon]
MHVQKFYLPVILATLLIIAFLPPVSADSQFSNLNTASGFGSLTAGKGPFPSFLSPAATPAPFVFSDSSDFRAGLRPTQSIESRLPETFVLADYLARLPPPELEIRVSHPRMSWDEIFTRPSCGCGGC